METREARHVRTTIELMRDQSKADLAKFEAAKDDAGMFWEAGRLLALDQVLLLVAEEAS